MMHKGIMITVGIVLLLGAIGLLIFNHPATSGNVVKNPDVVSNNAASAVSNNAASVISDSNIKVIYIDASSFAYSPDTIKVKKGEHVRIIINNVDTAHGISIPDLSVTGTDSVDFTANTAGTYQFKCSTNCGTGQMIGTLIVEE